MLYLRNFPAPLKHDGKDWRNEFFKNISKNLPQCIANLLLFLFFYSFTVTYRMQMKKSLEIDGLKVKAVRNSPMLTIAQSNSLLTFGKEI
jgi:hypothetical protein